MYAWLPGALRGEFEEVRLLKESSRGAAYLIRHKATGQKFILRQFQGSAEVYRKLLG